MVNPFKPAQRQTAPPSRSTPWAIPGASASLADARNRGPFGTYYKKRWAKIRGHPWLENSIPNVPDNTYYEPAKLSHLTPCPRCSSFVGHLEKCIEHLCAVCDKPRNGFDHPFKGCPIEAPFDIYEAKSNPMQPFDIPDGPIFPGIAVFKRLGPKVPLVIGRYPTVHCPLPLLYFFKERFARNRNITVLQRCDDMVLRIGLLHLRCLLDRSLRDRRQLLADVKRLRNYLDDVTLSPRGNRHQPVLATPCEIYSDVRGTYKEWGLDHVLIDFAQKDTNLMSREELMYFLIRGTFVRDTIDNGNFEIQNYIAKLNFCRNGAFRSMSPEVMEGYGNIGRETEQVFDGTNREIKQEDGGVGQKINKGGSGMSTEFGRTSDSTAIQGIESGTSRSFPSLTGMPMLPESDLKEICSAVCGRSKKVSTGFCM